jgi:hypothetical protein
MNGVLTSIDHVAKATPAALRCIDARDTGVTQDIGTSTTRFEIQAF